jgi:GH25 family lysozyme M1 (1,4-beta-N-acetylmuramidase)
MTRGTGYAKEFCDRVTALTGVKPIIYMSTSTTTSFDWSDFIKSYPYLWGAEYNKNPMVAGYTDNPEKKNRSLGGFKEIIRQYSSNTYLPGFPNRLDVNEAYISRKIFLLVSAFVYIIKININIYFYYYLKYLYCSKNMIQILLLYIFFYIQLYFLHLLLYFF